LLLQPSVSGVAVSLLVSRLTVDVTVSLLVSRLMVDVTVSLLVSRLTVDVTVSLLVSRLTVDIFSTFCAVFAVQCVKLMLKIFEFGVLLFDCFVYR